MVGWWQSSWSTPSKIYEQDFKKVSESFPEATFFTADIDVVPRAAYDMEVTSVPQISVLPIGSRPGKEMSLYDKTDLKAIRSDGEFGFSTMFETLRNVVSQTKFNDQVEDQRATQPWVFDPATGTSVPRHQMY